AGANSGELTTPTAAAILSTLAEGIGPMPALSLGGVGYGAGSREGGAVPNLLRVFVGESDDIGEADVVVELSANLDDCTGEILGATMDQLHTAGCLDVWATPIYMKKSRPAWMISALAAEVDAARVEEILFQQTTTFGLRRRSVTRSKLARSYKTVETPYGPIRIKIGCRGDAVLTASPEFADCRNAAETHHVPIREVMDAANLIWRSETSI
ncbi:unnamed protein product, partial [marine sediment metagenome]